MTRMLLLLSAAGLLAACAGAAGESAESAAPDDPRAVAEAYLAATEGDAEGGAVEDQLAACFAARRLLRSGYADGDATRRDRDALALAATVYHRLPTMLACAEAPMILGLSYRSGWLPAREPDALAQQAFRHMAATLHFDLNWRDEDDENNPDRDALERFDGVRPFIDLPASLLDDALEGVAEQGAWIADLKQRGAPARYEAAMRAYFGIGQPPHRGLSAVLARYTIPADSSRTDRRLAGLMALAASQSDFWRGAGEHELRLAALLADGVAAAEVGRRALRDGEDQEALTHLLVAATAGGPVRLDLIEAAERRLSPAERAAARDLAHSILLTAPSMK